MTFQNIQSARVVRAVASAFGLAVVLSLLAQVVIFPFLPEDMMNRMVKMSMNRTYEQTGEITDDYRAEYTALLVAQWTMALLATVWMGRWAAKQATSPQQAVGYGTAVGLGVMFSYGVLCIGFSLVNPLLRLGFFLLLPLAGMLGGRWAAGNLDKFRRTAPTFGPQPTQPQSYGFPPLPQNAAGPSPWGPSSGSGPDVYYNMGITAAMGARREEARGHFTRALQMNPYYLPAWLQLANLADTPEQAWNYIQQARAINPNDPAVVNAVNLIWPQVAANAARSQQVRNESLLREIEGREAATAVEFPVIQPPPVIAAPPATAELPADTPADSPVVEPPTPVDPLSERPTLRELRSEMPMELDHPPVVPELPKDSGEKKNPDTFDPWG